MNCLLVHFVAAFVNGNYLFELFAKSLFFNVFITVNYMHAIEY